MLVNIEFDIIVYAETFECSLGKEAKAEFTACALMPQVHTGMPGDCADSC